MHGHVRRDKDHLWCGKGIAGVKGELEEELFSLIDCPGRANDLEDPSVHSKEGFVDLSTSAILPVRLLVVLLHRPQRAKRARARGEKKGNKPRHVIGLDELDSLGRGPHQVLELFHQSLSGRHVVKSWT